MSVRFISGSSRRESRDLRAVKQPRRHANRYRSLTPSILSARTVAVVRVPTPSFW